MTKTYYVYILASKRNGTLYVGVTNDLERRLYEHKNNLVEGFTSRYNVHKLVYYEEVDDIQTALRLVRAAHNALDKAMDRSR